MSKTRLRAFVPIIAIVIGAMALAACDSGDDEGDAAEGLTIGVSWNNYNEERWAKSDEPAIQAALTAAGATYISADAGSSAEQQLADIENLIAQGADGSASP